MTIKTVVQASALWRSDGIAPQETRVFVLGSVGMELKKLEKSVTTAIQFRGMDVLIA